MTDYVRKGYRSADQLRRVLETLLESPPNPLTERTVKDAIVEASEKVAQEIAGETRVDYTKEHVFHNLGTALRAKRTEFPPLFLAACQGDFGPIEQRFRDSRTNTASRTDAARLYRGEIDGEPWFRELFDRLKKRYARAPRKLAATLRRAKNLVLEGVPGTGKTFAVGQICEAWEPSFGRELGGRGDGEFAITMHPATTYEDLVEGLRPNTQAPGTGLGDASRTPWVKPLDDAMPVLGADGEPLDEPELAAYFHVHRPDLHGATADRPFTMQDGFFLRVCARAVNDPGRDYVVLLDELNRCNVPKVLGDLLTTIERSKRARWSDDLGAWDLSNCQVVALPGSKRLFFVPDNIYVVATMNTTDRSVAPLDAALRRRFAFERLWPSGFAPGEPSDGRDFETPGELRESFEAWRTINGALRTAGPDAMLGHSYLYDLKEDLQDVSGRDERSAIVRYHWNHHILPQLAEVLVANNLQDWLKDPGKLGDVRVDGHRVVDQTAQGAKGLLQVPTLWLVADEPVRAQGGEDEAAGGAEGGE